MNKRKNEEFQTLFNSIEDQLEQMVQERAKAARYNTFKYFAIGNCQHCAELAEKKMKENYPEKYAVDRDFLLMKLNARKK